MTETGHPRARRGRWRRRLAGSALLVLASLVAAELVLRARVERVPLVVETGPGRLGVLPRRSGFAPLDVPARPEALRIVYMGASMEVGFPFTPAYAPAAWVERILAWRGVEAEVLCLACAGLSGRDTLNVLPDALALHPAAIVVGIGHNEYLRTDELLAPWWQRLELVRRLHALWAPTDVADVAPTLDSDFDRSAVADGLRETLRELEAMTAAAGVTLIVTVPVCNLADCPPMLGDDARLAESPDAAWDRGRALLACGDVVGARAAFDRALDTDRWPHRTTTALIGVILEEARRVVRTDLAFDSASLTGVPGDDLFVDHCHPVPAGSRLLAVAVCDALEEFGVVPASGRAGQAPDLAILAEQAGVTPELVAQRRAEAARAYTLFALHTGRHGRMADVAAARIAASAEGAFSPGEAQTMRALLALLRGDVEDARARLQEVRRTSPQMLDTLAHGFAGYRWIRQAFEQNGLSLDDAAPAPGP